MHTVQNNWSVALQMPPTIQWSFRLTVFCYTGAAAFMGLGAYTYVSGMMQLSAKEAEIARSNTRFGIGIRRLGIQGMAAGLFGLGVYRAFFTR
jgi:hypothetical protein